MAKAKAGSTGDTINKDELTLDNITPDTQETQETTKPEQLVVREIIREVAPTATPQSNVPSTAFLRNEKVTVKYVKKMSAYIKDPKHVGYGGLFTGSAISIPAPRLDNNKMKNILTKEEKEGLEYILGKDLSIYGPFWKETYGEGNTGIFPIYLEKEDTTLDLSDPMQYIMYKVLLASPIVANTLEDVRKKATYRFVLVSEGEELRKDQSRLGNKVIAFENYVGFKNDKAVLRYVLRSLGKYTSKSQKLDFLQVETAKMIDVDPNMFVAVTSDKLIKQKVLLEEGVEYGVVLKRDEKFYTTDNKVISDGDTPTLSVAAAYLDSALGQEMRLVLEAKIKNARE